ncbi:MAG TPA: phytoene desaturase family protein [Anaerolineales bacterium]|nr:phytoene desaturase family protein [Anaerolineales bacterium]
MSTAAYPSPPRPRAVVIGAGLGGLSAAAHLAGRGFQVTVVEKNAQAGGRCGRVVRDGHTFDTGPTLLVLPDLYAQEWAALGEDVYERLELRRVEPTYRLLFDDGRSLDLTSDLESMRRQLEAIEPGSYAGLQRYLEEGRLHYDLSMERVVRRPFDRAADFFRPEILGLIFRLKALLRHYPHTAAYFDDPRLRAAFTFQDGYMGLSPFAAAATFSLMPYSELMHGVWFPRGGMYRVAEELQAMAERRGAEFLFESPVERILTKADSARGVLLEDGRELPADVVVANADLPYVYEQLLPGDGRARRLRKLHYSFSAISFLWGVDRTYPELGPHTLFLADDFRGTFEAILRRRTLPEQPTVYIHAPARLDASMAPSGQDTLIAIVPVGHLDDQHPQDWADLEQRALGAILSRLASRGITDLEAHLKFEMTITPALWRDRLNLVKGSTHGLSHTLLQMAWFRPHNRHARFHNLYFAGASTHPGTGVPTVIVSGRLAAERAARDLGL